MCSEAPGGIEDAGETRHRLIPAPPVRKECTGQEPQAQPDSPRRALHDGFHSCSAISLGTGCLAPIVGAMRFRTAVRLDLSIGKPGPRDLTVRIGSFVGATKHLRPTGPPHPRLEAAFDRTGGTSPA
ncbi:hypothetical protein S58_05590 [Bradyrhizobium oligotrophicum S58]|uniref:Uncharacterized protein n=1 Tax=Bradyrhizobium oligotrophicum S58 TaxID=1245469 RepID=M4Z0I3_9BRAD|nr:hypothetical protein S58_05590 [Bradyrhizobium oligotrophicum S58]